MGARHGSGTRAESGQGKGTGEACPPRGVSRTRIPAVLREQVRRRAGDIIRKTVMEITADYADDADAKLCERDSRSTRLTQWVSATSAASACPSASIREIRGSISGFRIFHKSASHRSIPKGLRPPAQGCEAA